MRTKTLICAAALAAGLATSVMAQSNVYSLNVVGYVNVPVTGGGLVTLLGNPLNNTAANGNNITNLFVEPFAQDGDQVFTWDPVTQNLGGTIYTYSAVAHAWDGNIVMAPGVGFLYLNAGVNHTNTFVGDVPQGAISIPLGPPAIYGGAAANVIASPVPIGLSFTNAVVGITPQDGDQVFTWDVPSQNLGGSIATYSAVAVAWDNTAINVDPGLAFLYLGAGVNQTTWTRNFTVQ